MSHRARLFVVPSILVALHVVGAQTGSVVGTVARDSAGHMIGGAEIRVGTSDRGASTNYMGEFRLDGLAPGKYALTVRSIGFRPLMDSIDITAGRTLECDFVMTAVPVTELDTVRSRATAKKYLSPMLNGVEERRALHMGGYFITDSVLRRDDNEKMIDVLNKLPGMITFQKGPGAFAASGRSVGNGGPVFSSGGGATNPCYVTLFVDGVKIWEGPPGRGKEPPPNLSLYSVQDYGAIEYYPGPASLPVQFHSGSSCGTLLLWTREK